MAGDYITSFQLLSLISNSSEFVESFQRILVLPRDQLRISGSQREQIPLRKREIISQGWVKRFNAFNDLLHLPVIQFYFVKSWGNNNISILLRQVIQFRKLNGCYGGGL